MKDEKYPDAVIICPASDVGEDKFQSKKSLPPKPSTGDSLYFFIQQEIASSGRAPLSQ
jgi:hypothetical protein